MENVIKLTPDELKEIRPGEALTVASVMAILITAIVAVIAYRMFASNSGSATIPGGFKFNRE